MARVVTYECDECGCEITVSEMPETELTPIYCCGMEVTEVSPKKKPAKKVVKKTAKKAGRKTVARKPAAKKRTSKKSR